MALPCLIPLSSHLDRAEGTAHASQADIIRLQDIDVHPGEDGQGGRLPSRPCDRNPSIAFRLLTV